MNEILIREARVEDAVVVADFVTQLGYPTTAIEMEKRLKAMLARSDYVLLLAEH